MLLLVAAVFSVCGWLCLWLVFAFAMCFGFGVIVVVDAVSTTFGVERFLFRCCCGWFLGVTTSSWGLYGLLCFGFGLSVGLLVGCTS